MKLISNCSRHYRISNTIDEMSVLAHITLLAKISSGLIQKTSSHVREFDGLSIIHVQSI